MFSLILPFHFSPLLQQESRMRLNEWRNRLPVWNSLFCNRTAYILAWWELLPPCSHRGLPYKHPGSYWLLNPPAIHHPAWIPKDPYPQNTVWMCRARNYLPMAVPETPYSNRCWPYLHPKATPRILDNPGILRRMPPWKSGIFYFPLQAAARPGWTHW